MALAVALAVALVSDAHTVLGVGDRYLGHLPAQPIVAQLEHA